MASYINPYEAQMSGPDAEVIRVVVGDETTALTVGTGKHTFRMPFKMRLVQVRASLTTAAAGAAVLVDINEGGTSVLGTQKLQIDAGENTSVTAANVSLIVDKVLNDDAEITIDLDQVGVATTEGKGLKVTLYGIRLIP